MKFENVEKDKFILVIADPFTGKVLNAQFLRGGNSDGGFYYEVYDSLELSKQRIRALLEKNSVLDFGVYNRDGEILFRQEYTP
jgi:hypothetical protein